MKYSWFLALVLATCTLCAEDKEEDPLKTLANNNTTFGINLYKAVKDNAKNICLSPYSIASALAIPYIGAQNETKTQMQETLHFNPIDKLLAQSIGDYNEYLTKHPSNYPATYKIIVANSLWIQDRQRIVAPFISAVRKDFHSSVQRVDFVNQTETSRAKINRWVSHRTSMKIVDLIGKGVISASTRMVVVSALYLKSKWLYPFPKGNTHTEPFFPSPKKTISLLMMQQTGEFPFTESENAYILELPLEQPAVEAPQLTMLFVLPKINDGLPKIENELTLEQLDNWISKLQTENVSITIPKFTLKQSIDLAKILPKMGMINAFTGEADFSGITGNKDLLISNILHQTYLDVEEGGVEATAATAVIMNMKAVFEEKKPKIFKADHPFLFFMRDRTTGGILFLGRFVES